MEHHNEVTCSQGIFHLRSSIGLYPKGQRVTEEISNSTQWRGLNSIFNYDYQGIHSSFADGYTINGKLVQLIKEGG